MGLGLLKLIPQFYFAHWLVAIVIKGPRIFVELEGLVVKESKIFCVIRRTIVNPRTFVQLQGF